MTVASDSYSAVRMTGFPKKSIWKFAASKAANKNSKKNGKDQETIQSSTTPDPEYHMGK